MNPPGGSRNKTHGSKFGPNRWKPRNVPAPSTSRTVPRQVSANANPSPMPSPSSIDFPPGSCRHNFRPFKHQAIRHDQRNVRAQRLINRDADRFHQVIDNGHRGRDHGNIGRDADLFRHQFAHHRNHPVGGRHDEGGRQTHRNRIADAVGDGERRAHAQHHHEHRVLFPQTGDEGGSRFGRWRIRTGGMTGDRFRSSLSSLDSVQVLLDDGRNLRTLFWSMRPTAREEIVAPEIASISQGCCLAPCFTAAIGAGRSSRCRKFSRNPGSLEIRFPSPGVSFMSITWNPVMVCERDGSIHGGDDVGVAALTRFDHHAQKFSGAIVACEESRLGAFQIRQNSRADRKLQSRK